MKLLYLPLHLRLTFFYAVVLGLALWFFGTTVYTQAHERAYQDLDELLRTRAASVRLGKYIANPELYGELVETPVQLRGVDSLGTGGVSIEVMDQQFRLLASTSNSIDPAYIEQEESSSPVPWDKQTAVQLLQDTNSSTTNTNSTIIYKSPPLEAFSTIVYNGQNIRIYTLINTDSRPAHVIQTARSLASVEQQISELRQLLINSAIFVMLFTSGGGWFISWRVLKAVRNITTTAQTIRASQDFSKRVSGKAEAGRDELETLAATFNQMLASLEEVYQRQQRFVADASHELRAPITSIRCNLDLLTKAPDLPSEEKQAALFDARTEAERMGRLVNDLLLLAQADSTRSGEKGVEVDYRKGRACTQEVELDSLLLDTFRQYRHLNEHRNDDQIRQGPRLLLHHTTPAKTCGDADALKQAIVALVDNAVKYTPRDGVVSLSLTIEENFAIVKVSDTGYGIFTEDLPHIFERFYRADRARSRDRGGSGLGLAIVQSIIQDHQGSVEVESTPGKGSTFLLKLPALPFKQ